MIILPTAPLIFPSLMEVAALIVLRIYLFLTCLKSNVTLALKTVELMLI